MNKGYLKNAIEWGVELGVEIARDLEDNKLTFMEAIGLWDNALKIPKLVKSLKHIPVEWNENKNDQSYMDAIISGVSSKVKGLGTETAKELVIQGIKAGIETGKFIDLCAKAHKESKK